MSKKISEKVRGWLTSSEKNCGCGHCHIMLEDTIDNMELVNECFDCIGRNIVTLLEDLERLE